MTEVRFSLKSPKSGTYSYPFRWFMVKGESGKYEYEAEICISFNRFYLRKIEPNMLVKYMCRKYIAFALVWYFPLHTSTANNYAFGCSFLPRTVARK